MSKSYLAYCAETSRPWNQDSVEVALRNSLIRTNDEIMKTENNKVVMYWQQKEKKLLWRLVWRQKRLGVKLLVPYVLDSCQWHQCWGQECKNTQKTLHFLLSAVIHAVLGYKCIMMDLVQLNHNFDWIRLMLNLFTLSFEECWTPACTSGLMWCPACSYYSSP